MKRLLSVPLALYLMCIGCGGEDPVPFPEEDRLLERLMEEYVSARFRFYPVESTLAGLPGNDAALGSYRRTDVGLRVAWLSNFHGKLTGLEWKALSRPAYLDGLWLVSLVKAELFDLEERKLWERSAAFYGDIIRAGLVSLLMTPDLPNRTEELASRLEAVSVVLDQARENLATGSDSFRADGLRSLQLCYELLSEMPLLLEERLPSYRLAELSEESRLATRSLQALVTRISEAPSVPEVEASARLGREGLRLYFLHHEMVDWEPDRILREAEGALAITTAQITELALERFPDRDLVGKPAANAASAAPESPEAPEAQVAAYEERARRFLVGKVGEESLPETAIPVRVVPHYFIAPDVVRLWRPASLDPMKEASLLVGSTSGIDPVELELLTLGELSGSYRLHSRQSESASLLRRVFRSRTTSDGFRSWCLARVLEREYGAGGGEYELRFRQLQQARIEEVRLATVVGLHAFDMSLGEAERRFRDDAGLAREAASQEAFRAAAEPGVGSAALGRILLSTLARDFVRTNPLSSPEELDSALLSEGLLPPRLIRFELLGTAE
ncbi:MAG: DUF885 family protein [Vicinamibacteria bacterium]